MSTAARLDILRACSNRYLSFIKCILNGATSKQLHVEVSHKENTDIICYHWILIDAYHHRDTCLWKYLTNLFRMTTRYKCNLNKFSIVSYEIFKSCFIKLIEDTVSIGFELKVELLEVLIKVTMTWNVNHLWVLGQYLFERLKIERNLLYYHFFLVLFQDWLKTIIFILEI